jgi:NAD(P)-dependent dehydrogenase (short-subunit alcohol dehydrogenase family)
MSKVVETEVGGIDGVVHAVGSVFLKPLHGTSGADWRTAFELNATSAFIVRRNIMPRLMRRKRGSGRSFFDRRDIDWAPKSRIDRGREVGRRRFGAFGGDKLRALRHPGERQRSSLHQDEPVKESPAE